MRNLLSIVALFQISFLISCTVANHGMAQPTQESMDQIDTSPKIATGEQWGNISDSIARILILTYCKYSDAQGDLNATKSIWFKKDQITESFANIYNGFDKNLLTGINYSGYRIYLARYPSNWNEATARDANTVVITLTEDIGSVPGEINKDILEYKKISLIFVQPLNNGGRCPPRCQGTSLLDNLYTNVRH
jgi:hypothetical protein